VYTNNKFNRNLYSNSGDETGEPWDRNDFPIMRSICAFYSKNALRNRWGDNIKMYLTKWGVTLWIGFS
jgi:hypothetical protein